MLPSNDAVEYCRDILSNYRDDADVIADYYAENGDLAEACSLLAINTIQGRGELSGTNKSMGLYTPEEALAEFSKAFRAAGNVDNVEETVRASAEVKAHMENLGIDIYDAASFDIVLMSLIYPLLRFDLFPDSSFSEMHIEKDGVWYDWTL